MLKVIAFCHLQENLVINMVKKLMDTATKTWIDAAKTASKSVVEKIAEATGDLIGNKIPDKITSIGKPKRKNKRNRRNLHSIRKKTTNYWWLEIVLSIKCAKISVPSLELLSCVLLAKLLKNVKNSRNKNFEIASIFYWSDFGISLYWISSIE